MVKHVAFSTTELVRDTCMCLHVQRAARALARRFDDALRPVGLTNAQFSLLMSLNRPGPAGMKAVADLLAMDRTTLTAALKVLERRKLVAIRVDPEDKRGRLLSLTGSGQRVLKSAVPLWKATQNAIADLPALTQPDRLRAELTALSKPASAAKTKPISRSATPR